MPASLGIVHHANQYLITDGYENREGLGTVLDGLSRILQAHLRTEIPFNLHISGTLLEAAAWQRPEFLGGVRELLEAGLIDLVGSCYGQNVMRFFDADYNRKQLNEELRLFRFHLGVKAGDVKVFWPPERVWETRSMAPVLRDAALLNEGYRYVILDDRLLLSRKDPELPRDQFDEAHVWTPELYQMHEIESGLGMMALPIATRLRRSIPPRSAEDWKLIRSELEGLLVHGTADGCDDFLALYADDMEKVAGLWGADNTEKYEEFLVWLQSNRWVAPVRLSEWTRNRQSCGRRRVETGTFAELARSFEAGEGYEKWFLAPDWAPYRGYFEWADRRVQQLARGGADAGLIELAHKQLLVSNWETAWHTPADGPHGDSTQNGHASPWARALTSHSRHAAVTAEAAHWMRHKDGRAHANLIDIDNDGEREVVLKNDHLFGVIAPSGGGRLVALYRISGERGVMLVGNPCDDWNWMEELNRYMHTPRNHPGAFADCDYEDEGYVARLEQEEGAEVCVVLESDRGIRKEYRMSADAPQLSVSYTIPGEIADWRVEFGLSPDYLALLREGSRPTPYSGPAGAQGCATGPFAVWVRPGAGAAWCEPRQTTIGHGCMLSVEARSPEFQVELGSAVVEEETAATRQGEELEPVLL